MNQGTIWQKNQLAAVLSKQISANFVKIDSRQVKANDIFIGIKGDKSDGNNFVLQALQKGAALCITNSIPQNCMKHKQKMVVVSDTYADGLLKLAKYKRNQSHKNAIFIGVTGSVGKTTTKQMLRLVLQKSVGNCYANPGNKNSKYGVPLSLANIDKHALKVGVFQMGMSQAGQMQFLSQIVKPNIAVITNIAPAHLANFKSIEQIALAKAQILQHTGQFLVINCDTPCYDLILNIAAKRQLKVIGYSKHKINSSIYAKIYIKNSQVIQKQDDLFTQVTTSYSIKQNNQHQIKYRIKGVGEDLVINSGAVLGVLLALNENPNAIQYLKEYDAVGGRGQIFHLSKINIKLVDESYNSNPISLGVALNRIKYLSEHSNYKRKVAIIGDMLELGQNQINYHQKIIQHLNSNEIDKVHCVGKLMKSLYEQLKEQNKGVWCQTAEGMANNIAGQLQQLDLVMIKGSNGIKMHKIGDKIKSMNDLKQQA